MHFYHYFTTCAHVELAKLLIEGTDNQNSWLSGLATAAFFGTFNWICEI
jgi:hypothetical protein